MIRALGVLWFVLVASLVEAKTLYVNAATGNDATNYATNDANNPWASLCRAARGTTSCSSSSAGEAAQQGDTVMVAAGTYSAAGQNNRFIPAHYPVNDGASGQPIVFIAVGTVELRLSSGSGPGMGCVDNSYVSWTTFPGVVGKWYIDEDFSAGGPDTGPVVMKSSDHCVINRLEVNGHYINYPGSGGDNHNGIRVEFCDDCTITNCLIYGIGSIEGTAPSEVSAYRQNDAGIMLYSSNRVLIEHNEVHTTGTAVYIKDLAADTGTQTDIIVRFNYFHDTVVHGVFVGKSQTARIYQNVFLRTAEFVHFRDLADSAGPEDDDFPNGDVVANNTAIDVTYGVGFSGAFGLTTGVVVQGNIISATDRMIVSLDGDYTGPGDVTTNRNVYRGAYPTFADFAAADYTLAAYRTAFSMDADSITTDPQFLGGSTCRGYELHAASAARNLSVDVADIDDDANTSETNHAGACQTGAEVFGIVSETAAASGPVRLRIRVALLTGRAWEGMA